ncbi:hypothetical protein [Rhizobium leguminosarum]
MIEKVAKAIEGVNLFSRYNDWTSDRVEGLPIEICQRSTSGVVEDDVIVARFAGREQDCSRRLDEVRRVWRARAALEALRTPTEAMLDEGPPFPYMDNHVWARMIDAALKDNGEKA